MNMVAVVQVVVVVFLVVVVDVKDLLFNFVFDDVRDVLVDLERVARYQNVIANVC